MAKTGTTRHQTAVTGTSRHPICIITNAESGSYSAVAWGLARNSSVDRVGEIILAIPALNKDVKTFDQMALALHYHMFQLVIVANSGQYVGSNAYWLRERCSYQAGLPHPRAAAGFDRVPRN